MSLRWTARVRGGRGAQASQPLCVIFIHPPNRYLLSIYYVPRTGLGAADTAGGEADTVSAPRILYSSGRDSEGCNEGTSQIFIVNNFSEEYKTGLGKE